MDDADRRRLIVLMYHGLHADALDPGCFDPRYSVTPARFEQHLQRLLNRCSEAWLPPEHGPLQLPACRARPAVMISFDDGDVSNALQALPALQRHGLRALFFVTSEFVGRAGMLSPRQLRQLADAGMTIGAHGASHRFLNGLDAAELRRELCDGRDRLQQLTGRRVDLLALPGGRGGRREVEAALDCGYRAVFGSEPGDNAGWQPGALLERAAITRDMKLAEFEQVLGWHGAAVRRLRWRHQLLAMPKRVLGDERYDRLRQALVG